MAATSSPQHPESDFFQRSQWRRRFERGPFGRGFYLIWRCFEFTLEADQ